MDRNCNACEELRENAPDFLENGVTKNVCASLKNNTGMSPASDNKNCEDLDNANDCLVGNMADEVEAYDTCDWKDYIRKFVPNVYNILKAIICSLCGAWSKVEKHDCEIDYLFKGARFSVGEEKTDGSYAVAGKGISFLQPKSGQEHTGDLNLLYIAGGLIRNSGSFNFYNDSFTDDDECYNYDNDGVDPQLTKSRQGNKVWDSTGAMANGGELIVEYRIKRSQYPELGTLYSGFGQETGGGGYHVRANVFEGGQYAYGQHGWCDSKGNPDGTGYSKGHLVPDGWVYVQLRMSYIWTLNANGKRYSPIAFMGVRMNRGNLEC